MSELVENSKKLPLMVPLTVRQEFAQKSEKALCFANLSAK